MTAMKTIIRSLAVLALVSCLWVAATPIRGSAQEQAAQPSAQSSPEKPDTEKPNTEKPASPTDQTDQQEPQHTGIGRELAKETREAEGEEEEHADLKHSAMVQRLARLTGLSVHGAHLLALGLNFAIIVILVVWAMSKSVPGILRKRNESIQHALEEARKASQDANRR